MLLFLCSCGTKKNFADLKDSKTQQETSSSSDTQETESSEEETVSQKKVDLINIDGLNAVESNDISKVKITSKEVKRDAFSGINLDGNDALVFTVTNNEKIAVTSLTIYYVGYKDNNELVALSSSLSLSGDHIPYVRSLVSADGKTINPGASEEMAMKVHADTFSGVKAIVASYTTSDGKEHKNSIAEDWVDSIQLGKNTVLE